MSSRADGTVPLGLRRSPPEGPRRLAVTHFVLLVIAYLVIAQGMTTLLMMGDDAAYAAPTSTDYVIRTIVVPVGLASAFALIVVCVLGTWREVFSSDRPLRCWTLLVPVIMLLTVAIATNYPGLAAKGLLFWTLLLVSTLMVGFGEELMFRGVGVYVLRDAGLSETKVALWSSLIFGLAHGSNLIFTVTHGVDLAEALPRALFQITSTTVLGFVLYLVLRSTGLLVAGMAIHGLWDFSVLSTQIDPDGSWPLVGAAPVGLVLIVVLTLVFRKQMSRVKDDPRHTQTSSFPDCPRSP